MRPPKRCACAVGSANALKAGGSFTLQLAERLLSTLLYYRLLYYRLAVTGGLLGYLFGLDESNLSRGRNLRMRPVLLQVLPVPMRDHLLSAIEESEESHQEPSSGPHPSRPKNQSKKRIGTLKELLAAHPEFAEVWLDATEQEVPKPQHKPERKYRYIGKQKCHTLKTQVVTTKNLVLHILGACPEGCTTTCCCALRACCTNCQRTFQCDWIGAMRVSKKSIPMSRCTSQCEL
jgi:hypothetical protein